MNPTRVDWKCSVHRDYILEGRTLTAIQLANVCFSFGMEIPELQRWENVQHRALSKGALCQVLLWTSWRRQTDFMIHRGGKVLFFCYTRMFILVSNNYALVLDGLLTYLVYLTNKCDKIWEQQITTPKINMISKGLNGVELFIHNPRSRIVQRTTCVQISPPTVNKHVNLGGCVRAVCVWLCVSVSVCVHVC